MNIAEILKDCPKGSKLYSPIFGEVKLIEVNSKYILVRNDNSFDAYFTIQGRFDVGCDNGECLLFPSKENRDWSTFKVPKKKYDFKPFERVLVRDGEPEVWKADLFSHYYYNTECCYATVCCCYKQCIPYEGNEHLLGTNNNPD